MSEYQYYEFQAIDRPLSEEEMREVRSYSTRARITPTSFVNEYNWGDFKGKPDGWMEKYFDAFLYLANWGTHILKLRLPSKFLAPQIARQYFGGDSASIREKAHKVILTFESENEDGHDFEEGEGTLASLLSVRAELARGDLRALYLGWMLRIQNEELDDDELEPPVPPGLGQLSASLESLADFIRIDRDLLHVAGEASATIAATKLDRKKLRGWVSRLPGQEKDEFVTTIIMDGDFSIANELRQRFLKEQSTDVALTPGPNRTVGDLLRAAESYAKERKRLEAEKRAQEKARREREAAAAREKHLDALVGRETQLWAKVENLIAAKQQASYDLAVKILIDLRDLDLRGQSGDFHQRMEALRQTHVRKPSLLKRLVKAGL